MNFIKSFSHCSGSLKSLDEYCAQDSTIYSSYYGLLFNNNTRQYFNENLTLTKLKIIKIHASCAKLYSCLSTNKFLYSHFTTTNFILIGVANEYYDIKKSNYIIRNNLKIRAFLTKFRSLKLIAQNILNGGTIKYLHTIYFLI